MSEEPKTRGQEVAGEMIQSCYQRFGGPYNPDYHDNRIVVQVAPFEPGWWTYILCPLPQSNHKLADKRDMLIRSLRNIIAATIDAEIARAKAEQKAEDTVPDPSRVPPGPQPADFYDYRQPAIPLPLIPTPASPTNATGVNVGQPPLPMGCRYVVSDEDWAKLQQQIKDATRGPIHVIPNVMCYSQPTCPHSLIDAAETAARHAVVDAYCRGVSDTLGATEKKA